MSAMGAVFRREFGAYFATPIALLKLVAVRLSLW